MKFNFIDMKNVHKGCEIKRIKCSLNYKIL